MSPGDGMRGFFAILCCAGFSLLFSVPATAQNCGPQVSVSFAESSPKDLIEIRNDSAPGWRLTEIAILLTGSRGELLFDTEAGGPGLSVYQPLEIATPGAQVKAAKVEDGARALTLSFDIDKAMVPGERLVITIDVDDTVQLADLGPTMISGNEIEGASVIAEIIDRNGHKTMLNAVFDRKGVAVSEPFACS